MRSLKIPVPVQAGALVLACVAIVWGGIAAEWAAFPGPSGEWAGLAVPAAALVDLPIGLLALGLGLVADRRSPRLRRLTIIAGVIALCLPPIVSFIWHRHW